MGQGMKRIILAGMAMAIAGCASAPQVVVTPRQGGIYTAEASGEDRAKVMQAALDKASAACISQARHYVVMDSKDDFHGTVNDDPNSRANGMASQAAFMLGAGMLTPSSTHSVTVTFKCEA
jgi:hypothetical protein